VKANLLWDCTNCILTDFTINRVLCIIYLRLNSFTNLAYYNRHAASSVLKFQNALHALQTTNLLLLPSFFPYFLNSTHVFLHHSNSDNIHTPNKPPQLAQHTSCTIFYLHFEKVHICTLSNSKHHLCLSKPFHFHPMERICGSLSCRESIEVHPAVVRDR
jgi:hypothetical protein